MIWANRLAVVLALFLSPLGVSAVEPAPLTDAGRARAVCEGLRPSERVEFPGGAAQQAEARARFEQEREQLRGCVFAVELRWADFTVADWDPAAGAVRIAAERPLRALDGALSIYDLERTEIELLAVPGAEAALADGLKKGALTLALSFQPAEADPCPCTVSKLGELSFSVDLLAAELRADSRPVARAIGEGFVPFSRAQQSPSAQVRSADLKDGPAPAALVESLQAQAAALRDCHAKGLARVASLEGALVVEARSDEAGRLVVASVLADSLQDPEVVACVLNVLKASRAPKSTAGTVVVELGVEPQQEASPAPEPAAPQAENEESRDP